MMAPIFASPRSRILPRAGTLATVLAGALAGAACGSGRAPAPTAAATALAPAPDLGGRAVMLLPAQAVVGVPGDPDAELAFAVGSRPGGRAWVLPPALARALRANPSLDARLENLPVGMFLRAEVRRVGDPLFGILRRLAALTDAETAVIPVAVRYRTAVDSAGAPAAAGSPGAPAGPGAVEIAAAVLAVRTGQVIWFGVVSGEPAEPGDPAGLASAVDGLMNRLLPGGP